jgi:hypothetical protein
VIAHHGCISACHYQHFYQAIAQPPKSSSEAVAKSKTEVEPKGAIAQMPKSVKKKGLLDGVRLK